jgi:hypothetical protein
MVTSRRRRATLALGLCAQVLACACQPAGNNHSQGAHAKEPKVSSESAIPPHLREFPGLFVRVGDAIRDAPEADQAVARSYPAWPDKGPWTGERRITIMTARTEYRTGEEARVIHVVETRDPHDELYVMGPKEVRGEHVDGALATEPAPRGQDPLEPQGLYDGMVLPGPAVDYNYDITSYRFDTPGEHQIQWRLGNLQSNILRIQITAGAPD